MLRRAAAALLILLLADCAAPDYGRSGTIECYSRMAREHVPCLEWDFER